MKNPFYFNLLQVWFGRKKNLSDFHSISDKLSNEEYEKEILRKFIGNRINDFQTEANGQNRYSWDAKSIFKWLSFLANRMNRDYRVTYELKDVQYTWIEKSPKEILIDRLIPFTVLYLLAVFFLSFLFGINAILLFLFLFPLFGIPVFAYAFRKRNKHIRIETKERIRFNWKVLRANLKNGIFYGFSFSGLITFFLLLIVKLERLTKEVDIIEGTPNGFFVVLGIFLFVFVLFLVGGIVLLIDRSFLQSEYYHLPKISYPYQSFVESAYRLHFSIVRHWILRYRLYRKKLFPLRLIYFLNKMAEYHILESDGSTWRFRHRLIQDYFSQNWKIDMKRKMSHYRIAIL